jgi:sulfur relay (sulfurtransferase) DsrF/TusC family protein
MKSSKKIIISVSESPLGETFVNEALRTALGISAGCKEHKVDLLLYGDSVHMIRLPMADTYMGKLLRTLACQDSVIYLDKASLEERKLLLPSFPAPFAVIEREEIPALFRQADMNISL